MAGRLVPALVAVLLVALHRAEEGRLPDRLDDFLPRCGDRLPADPFTGTAFLWRKAGGGMRLLSPGPDLAPDTWDDLSIDFPGE